MSMPVVRKVLLVLSLAGLVSLTFVGCSRQGEGERCDEAVNGDADCDDGLVCRRVGETDRCCPPEGSPIGDSRCEGGATGGTGGTSGGGGDSGEAGDGSSTGGTGGGSGGTAGSGGTGGDTAGTSGAGGDPSGGTAGDPGAGAGGDPASGAGGA